MDLLRRIRGKGVAAVVDKDEKCEIFIVQEEREFKDIWVLVLGSFYYVCSNRKWFSCYEVRERRGVILFNGEEVKVCESWRCYFGVYNN